jgi:hypothetical protein
MMAKHVAPDWVCDALAQSPAPKKIVDALLNSKELAPLWDTMPQRSIVGILPELIGFAGAGDTLPWSEQWTAIEQRCHAKRIAKLARDLNRELAAFAPLAPFGLWQLTRQDDPSAHDFLVSLPVMAARRDSLLLRLASMADRFLPSAQRTVSRPTTTGAKETYLVRKLGELFGVTPTARTFIAELANAITGAVWDAERVRKSLARSPKTKVR